MKAVNFLGSRSRTPAKRHVRSDPVAEPDTAPTAPLSRWVALIAGLQATVLVATSTRYGYHGDEFYFIVAGSHPAFGYPDQPPIVPLLSWLMHDLGQGSPLYVRLPSAIVGGTTTALAALVARELGGARRAQLIAAGCAAVSAFALATSHLTSTTTYEQPRFSGW
jgi:4-amino-4-deoxy-L-arabinose transferase-like glycosyltransferase